MQGNDPKPRSAVIVEDEFIIAEYLRMLCGDAGIEVVGHASDGESALQLLRETVPFAVLMDVRIEGERDGVDVAQEIVTEQPDLRVIYITGSNEPPTIARIKEGEYNRVLIKPIATEALAEALA